MEGWRMEEMEEFFRLLTYFCNRDSDPELILRAIDDLKKDPIRFWELQERSLQLGWGVRGTVSWLKNVGFPEYLIDRFLVYRRVGIGYSSGYFFNNFYRKVRAILRFVSKYRDFSREKLEEYITEIAKDAVLVRDNTYYYYFKTSIKNFEIVFEVYRFEKVRVYVDSIRINIKHKTSELLEILKDKLKKFD